LKTYFPRNHANFPV